MSAEKSHVKP